jgi:hypothetical protein
MGGGIPAFLMMLEAVLQPMLDPETTLPRILGDELTHVESAPWKLTTWDIFHALLLVVGQS